jgi:hypothetical protein
LSINLGTLTFWKLLGHSRPVTGLLYLFLSNARVEKVTYSLFRSKLPKFDRCLMHGPQNINFLTPFPQISSAKENIFSLITSGNEKKEEK